MIGAWAVVIGLMPHLCPTSVGGGILCEIGLYGITESIGCKTYCPPPKNVRDCSIALGLNETTGEQGQDNDGKR